MKKKARFLNIFVTNFQNRMLTEIKENQRGTEDDSHLKRLKITLQGKKHYKNQHYFHFQPFRIFEQPKSTEMPGKIWAN